MVPLPQARVFEELGDKTVWGVIEESTPQKVTVKWDSVGFRGQTHSTFYGNLSAVTRYHDCWKIII